MPRQRLLRITILTGRPVLHSRGHLLDVHLNASVAGDVHDQFIGKGHLGADGGWQTRTPWFPGRRR
jgi:hypothetical protein